MIAIEKIVYYSQFPRRRDMSCHWGEGYMWGSISVCHKAGEEGRMVGKSFYYGFHSKEWMKQGKHS